MFILLTKLLQHFVTFIQNKMFQILERKLLAFNKSKNSARSSNNDVGTIVLQHLFILGNSQTSEEDSDLCNKWHQYFPTLISLNRMYIKQEPTNIVNDGNKCIFKTKYSLPWLWEGTCWTSRTPCWSGMQALLCDTWQGQKLVHQQAQSAAKLPRQRQQFYPFQTLPDTGYPYQEQPAKQSEFINLNKMLRTWNYKS